MAYTEAQVEALADAMWQLLDDMQGGMSVCLAAKAEARVALEPFLTPDRPECEKWMNLSYAKFIEREASQ